MRLINTIELMPLDFSVTERNYPDVNRTDFPHEWDRFWKECLSDRNLGQLEPVRKGSWLVDISSLHEDELAEILKVKLDDIDLSDADHQLQKMIGGIVLEENGKFYIEPTCCGDIGNITEWESIFEKEANEWNQLWIGHPWIFFKRDGNIVTFSNYTESNTEDFHPNEMLSMAEIDLQTEIKKMRDQQNDFRNRISSTLEKMGFANAAELSSLMIDHLYTD